MFTNNKPPYQFKNIEPHLFVAVLLLLILSPVSNSAMTVSGPIAANNVSVTGEVTMSSVTVSSVTSTNLINVIGITNGISGRVTQMKLFVSTVPLEATAMTTWDAVSAASQTITLSNANDYVRISLMGGLQTSTSGYITIFRDMTNLGDANVGLSASLHVSPVGIRIVDLPGGASTYTYTPYIRSGGSGFAQFPYGKSYFILEDISQ